MVTSTITQPAPSPCTSTILWGNKIHVYGLDMAHRQYDIVPYYKFQYQLTLIQLIQKQRLKINKVSLLRWTWRMSYIIKTIYWFQQELTPKCHHLRNIPQVCGESNHYVQFLYGPQKNFNHTQVQVSVSMDSSMVKTGGESKINYDNIETKTPKETTSKKCRTKNWSKNNHQKTLFPFDKFTNKTAIIYKKKKNFKILVQNIYQWLKSSSNHLINNYDYICRNNFCLAMYWRWKVSKSEMGKITTKVQFTWSINDWKVHFIVK